MDLRPAVALFAPEPDVPPDLALLRVTENLRRLFTDDDPVGLHLLVLGGGVDGGVVRSLEGCHPLIEGQVQKVADSLHSRVGIPNQVFVLDLMDVSAAPHQSITFS